MQTKRRQHHGYSGEGLIWGLVLGGSALIGAYAAAAKVLLHYVH